MGLFGSSSPFDADVERATNEKNTTDDWGLIMDICDKVGNNPVNAKDCLRSIIKRLNHNDPHVAIQAVTLLDACVNNCGKNFHLEVASREFENEFRKLLGRAHQTVQLRLKALLKKWSENEFKNDPQLNLIPALYYKLRQEGHVFLSQNETSSLKRLPTLLTSATTTAASGNKDIATIQQEEADIAKAIELSLKEGPPASAKTATTTSNSLYPSTNISNIITSGAASSVTTQARKVRALYDFEAAEDNELTFKAGEIVHVIDDTDPNWWKGYNQRGEGLFPANFVTADLSVEPEQLKIKQDRDITVITNKLNDTSITASKTIVEIDELKIDRLLHLLHEADPNDTVHNDPKELLILESEVNNMAPLIDSELERVDRKHAQLTQLSSDLVDALNLYHQLMREPPLQVLPGAPYATGLPAPPPAFNNYNVGTLPQQPPPQMMYNGSGHGHIMVSSYGPPPPGTPQQQQYAPPPPPAGYMQGPPPPPPSSQQMTMVGGVMPNYNPNT
ncbi:signal transducing adapter molecule 2 isoform X2 [Chrysoperla carnea]|nr:signal transducing adapter molecule 2 isoform X2 [Chrysoperla carnea]